MTASYSGNICTANHRIAWSIRNLIFFRTIASLKCATMKNNVPRIKILEKETRVGKRRGKFSHKMPKKGKWLLFILTWIFRLPRPKLLFLCMQVQNTENYVLWASVDCRVHVVLFLGLISKHEVAAGHVLPALNAHITRLSEDWLIFLHQQANCHEIIISLLDRVISIALDET